jgi:hypothetical protein
MQMNHWGDFTNEPLSQSNRAKFENFPENMEALDKKLVISHNHAPWI